LIVEVQNSNADFWESTRISKSADWNYIYKPKTITKKEHQTGELIIYFWNKHKKPLLIDDFEIRIVTENLF
jgi:hypothetical protein